MNKRAMIAERLTQGGAGVIDFAVATFIGISLAVIHKLNLEEVLKVTLYVLEITLVGWRLVLLWTDRRKGKPIKKILEDEE
jgi:hypothetical protein